jgi:hypothetical protein
LSGAKENCAENRETVEEREGFPMKSTSAFLIVVAALSACGCGSEASPVREERQAADTNTMEALRKANEKLKIENACLRADMEGGRGIEEEKKALLLFEANLLRREEAQEEKEKQIEDERRRLFERSKDMEFKFGRAEEVLANEAYLKSRIQSIEENYANDIHRRNSWENWTIRAMGLGSGLLIFLAGLVFFQLVLSGLRKRRFTEMENEVHLLRQETLRQLPRPE